MEIRNFLSLEQCKALSSALCNARCELEYLSETMQQVDIETFGECDCGDFIANDIQDIADTLSIVEDYFFSYVEELTHEQPADFTDLRIGEV